MAKSRLDLLANELPENKEGIRLIWLDSNINDSSDSIQKQKMLLACNTATVFYTDLERCLETIKSMKNEKILLIISGSFSRDVLPNIHDIQYIIAIYIFCANEQGYLSLKNEYNKIQGIFINQDKLSESIRSKLCHLERQAMKISLFDQKQKSSQDLSKEPTAFLWHQMIIHVLTEMDADDQAKQDFINTCQNYYEFDYIELRNINEFKANYCHGKAIEWYTKESFVYKLLNRALRTEDAELIYSFRFLLIDLCHEIEEEYFKTKTNKAFIVYRGQTISNKELDKWRDNIGTILSFNSFFSASRNLNIANQFASRHDISDDIECILFEIEVDPLVKSAIYADVGNITAHQDEEEILFNLNSLFEIKKIYSSPENNGTCRIVLKTTDEGTNIIKQQLIFVKQQINDSSPMIVFGWLVLDELGRVDKAEKYFNMLLKTLPSNHEAIASVYNGIGCVYSRRNNPKLALEYYNKAVEVCQKRSPPDYCRMVTITHNIANIYKDKRDFDAALENYEKALKIEEEYHPNCDLQKAIIIQNIGRTWIEKGDLDTAFKHLSAAREMLTRNLPENDRRISICLGDIGFYYEKKGELKEARKYYEEELTMDEKCLPSDHPYLYKDIKQIAVNYKQDGQIDAAVKFCKEKLNDQKSRLGNNHPCVAQILLIMAEVLENGKSTLEQVLPYYKDALIILTKSTPTDHEVIGKCLTDVGILCWKYNVFHQALDYLLNALKWYNSMPTFSPINIVHIHRIIGLCYQNLKDSSKALDHFNEALSICQANYESNNENTKLIEAEITKLNNGQELLTNTEKLVEESVNEQERACFSKTYTIYPAYNASNNENSEFVEEDIAKLNNEQGTSINTEESIKENIDEQKRACFNETFAIFQDTFLLEYETMKPITGTINASNNDQQIITKNITDEKHITVSIDPDTLQTLDKPISTPKRERPVKRKICPNCQIL